MLESHCPNPPTVQNLPTFPYFVGTIPLPRLPKACSTFLVWSSKSLRTMVFRGTQMVYWIHPVRLCIKSKFSWYPYLVVFWWPDTDTDSRNVSGRIQIQIVKTFSNRMQIQIVKNTTICPDNRYFARYPCIPNFKGAFTHTFFIILTTYVNQLN